MQNVNQQRGSAFAGLLEQRISDVRVVACTQLGCARRAGGSPQDVTSRSDLPFAKGR